MMRFVNREGELRALEEAWKLDKSLVIIYGRRRVGKTRLIKEFIKEKPSVYYMAVEATSSEHREEFSRAVRDQLGLPLSGDVPDVIEAASRIRGKFVAVLDEFQFMVESDPTLVSKLQRLMDSEVEVMLVLSGSAVSFFERRLLGYRSPILGRRTHSLHLKPLKVYHVHEFLPYDLEDLLRAYATVGGTPAYLEKFSPELTFWENVRRMITPGSYLYDEALNLLRQEVREPRTYFTLLANLARGRDRPSELASAAGVDPRNLGAYLSLLEDLDVVERERPLGKRKPVKVRIKDFYFLFYFRFVYRMRNMLEMGLVDEALERVKEDFNEYMGHAFELVVKELIPLMYREGLIRTKPVQVGRWWRGEDEIDLVIRDPGRSTTFVEVKWKELDDRDLSRVKAKLIAKADKSGLKSGEINYLVVCRRCPKNEDVLTLDDLEPLIKRGGV